MMSARSSREAIDIDGLEGATPYQCEENGAYIMCILDFFNMKTLLQLLFALKVISKCVLFQNNFDNK